MVLRALRGDFNRAQQAGQAAAGFPAQVVGDAEQQASTVGVAATGRVQHFLGGHDRNVDALAVRIDLRPFFATRDDQRVQAAGDVRQGQARTFHQHFHFIVVGRHIRGFVDEVDQLFAIEAWQLLTRIEHEGDAQLGQVGGVLEHALVAVGRNDGNLGRARIGDRVFMCKRHGARVEGIDLVIVRIGRDEALRVVAVCLDQDIGGGNAQLLQAFQVGGAVLAHDADDARVAAQHFQAVGDVARATAELRAHGGHEEGHVHLVQLVGQQRFAEAAGELHDGVGGERAADQRCFGHDSVG